jgi:hypothetical protein
VGTCLKHFFHLGDVASLECVEGKVDPVQIEAALRRPSLLPGQLFGRQCSVSFAGDPSLGDHETIPFLR